jgi:hypothetical protein
MTATVVARALYSLLVGALLAVCWYLWRFWKGSDS